MSNGTLDIQRHLAKGYSLTPMEAFTRFRQTRLADVIWRLKRKGFPVRTKISRNGKNHFAIYSLKDSK